MANIVKGLRTYLISKSTGHTAAGRVYFAQLPENPTYPAAALHLISSESFKNHGGMDGLRRSVVQVDCFGGSTGGSPYTDAVTLAENFKTQLEPPIFTKGTMGTETVRTVIVETMHDLDTEPGDGSEQWHMGRSFDVTIWHTE